MNLFSPFRDRVTLLLSLTFFFQLFIFLHMKTAVELKKRSTLDLVPSLPAAYSKYRYFQQRGRYTVLKNYVGGTDHVGFEETITLATIGTLEYVNNVAYLIKFWSGPISVALYVPGPEFTVVLEQIAYLRSCTRKRIGEHVKRRVWFHIFFETLHLPETNFSSTTGLYGLELPRVNCNQFPAGKIPSFRSVKGLMFPINVARNIAKENARTRFILVSDIELFPNPPQLIPRFLDLIKRRQEARILKNQTEKPEREVFVLPPFEVSRGLHMREIPRKKQQLRRLMKLKKPQAVPFHLYSCYLCHQIPKSWLWMNGNLTESGPINEINIFHSGPYITAKAWEPFYIGTYLDPPFDERLFRENTLNKPIQASILCHMNYTFHVLDNAFLVHKPGLKYGKSFSSDYKKFKGLEIAEEILPLQYALYGRSKNRCWQMKPPQNSSRASNHA